MDHLHVRDADYDTFYERKRLEDDTNISRGPINVQPNRTDRTALDDTPTQRVPNNLDIGGIMIEEMPKDNDEFIKRDISCKRLEQHRSMAAPRHLIVDSGNLAREPIKTNQDNVEDGSKVTKIVRVEVAF